MLGPYLQNQIINTPISSNGSIISSNGSILTTSNPYSLINTSTTGGYNTYTTYDTYDTYVNPLKNLNYVIDFEHIIDRFDLLEDNIAGIKKNIFLFNCKYEKNRIQPYELIMRLIKEKTLFSATVHVSDILSICYQNLQFIKIQNNLNFNTNCDFSVIKVKFKYEKLTYENHKLSEKELRSDKLKKIIENNE